MLMLAKFILITSCLFRFCLLYLQRESVLYYLCVYHLNNNRITDMEQNYNEIIDRFNKHLGRSGKRYYSEFYIGVSKNARKKLFEEHHVDMDSSWWIYVTAESACVAKMVEKHFLDLGMRGSNIDEDEASNMVYCYVVTPTTTE